jgi:hypothetical protein
MSISQQTTSPLDQTREAGPDASLPEVDFEKAMERWLDDGGTADHEVAYEVESVSPVQFSRPEGGLP